MAVNVPEPSFRFLPQGAIIQEFSVAGHNIVQSFPNEQLYRSLPDTFFFGETIGRTTNRIKNATIDDLNGRSYKLAQNNGPNSLHGGRIGFGKRIFEGPEAVNHHGKEGVLFKYISPHMEEGYPGTIELRVWYTAWKEAEGGKSKSVLEIEYEVEMVGSECEETVVGVTNHR